MPWISEERLWRFEQKLDSILANQRTAAEQEKRTAMTLADVDAALATTDTDVASLQAETAALIAQKQAQPDTTAEVTHLNNINTALSALLASENQAVTPVPSTPPATGGNTTPTTGSTAPAA